MNKILAIRLVLVIAIIGFFTSCKDEVVIDPIVGVWEYSEIERGGEDDVTDIIFSRHIELTFNPDNTGLEEIDYIIYDQPDSHNSNFVYLTKNGILTLFFGVEPTDYTYSISGNKLTIKYPSEELVFTKVE